MNRLATLMLAVLLTNCGSIVNATPNDGATADSSHPGEVCGGRTCAHGESCCLLNGTCVPTSQIEQCRALVTDGGVSDGGSRGACVSNSDCSPSEFCRASTCLGPGRCENRELMCEPGRALCGCDGQTYATVCDAARIGIRIAAPSACGTSVDQRGDLTPIIGCAHGQCPAGRYCCAITNLCLPDSCVDCCRIPPVGAVTTCRSNSDCPSASFYCAANTCEGVGGCVVRGSQVDCDGVSEPVCGCDGRTYVNACLARVAGIRVSRSGACQ